MLANDIVLDDVSGDDVTYRLFKQDSTGTSRIDLATNLVAPAIMSIRHSLQGKGEDAVDRHLVQFTRTINDASGTPRTLTVNVTIAIPRASVITATIVKDQVANAIDFLADGQIASLATTANLDALMRGES